MRRLYVAAMTLALAGALTASAGAETRTYFGFQIGVGSAPPPPVFVYQAPPPVYYEPECGVYVVNGGYGDCDMFRYGSFWYANDGGYWYRARTYRGPFMVVDVRSVPRPIFYVPEQRWHHYPSRLAYYHKQRGNSGWRSDPWYRHDNGWHGDKGDKDDNGKHGRDRGHGHGHQGDES